MSVDEAAIRKAFKDSGVKDEVMNEVGYTTSLLDSGVDSLDIANLLLSLEEQYDIKIPDEEAMQLDSLKAIVELVNSKLN